MKDRMRDIRYFVEDLWDTRKGKIIITSVLAALLLIFAVGGISVNKAVQAGQVNKSLAASSAQVESGKTKAIERAEKRAQEIKAEKEKAAKKAAKEKTAKGKSGKSGKAIKGKPGKDDKVDKHKSWADVVVENGSVKDRKKSAGKSDGSNKSSKSSKSNESSKSNKSSKSDSSEDSDDAEATPSELYGFSNGIYESHGSIDRGASLREIKNFMDKRQYDRIVDTYSTGTISIPSIRTTLPIIEGTTNEHLWTGATTLTPNQTIRKGNYTLLSHNTGYQGMLFTNLPQVKKGAEITVTSYAQGFKDVQKYVVTSTEVVDRRQTDATAQTKDRVLTLITCATSQPTFDRLIVRAKPV